MARQLKAFAFDLDAASLSALWEALPGWQISDIYGATVASLPRDWNPAEVDLLIVGVRVNVEETLMLCKFLSISTRSAKKAEKAEYAYVMAGNVESQATAEDVPLLVLVAPGQEHLIDAALRAGAHSCLMLPIYAQDVASMLVHAHAGNQPGRHTLNLENAQRVDPWQDDGGQG